MNTYMAAAIAGAPERQREFVGLAWKLGLGFWSASLGIFAFWKQILLRTQQGS